MYASGAPEMFYRSSVDSVLSVHDAHHPDSCACMILNVTS